MFCSPYDAELARRGPAAVFLQDPDGLWRHASNWTRDAWNRSPGPHRPGDCYLLLRDRATGFVQLVYTTSPDLITEHPRSDVRAFDTLAAALSARDACGSPPLAEAW